MPKKTEYEIKWMKEPEDHNFPAALSYLSLIYTIDEAKKIVKKLDNVKLSEFKAKDIFRASNLSLLGISNYHVEKNFTKIKNGEKLSPILLVRRVDLGTVVVADGYHRLCAVYHFDEDAIIPSRII